MRNHLIAGLLISVVSSTSWAANVDDLRKAADVLVSVNCAVDPDLMDVGITRSEARSGIQYFSRGDLVRFFDWQRHKGTVFVDVYLMTVNGKEKDDYVKSMVSYFSQRGFRNIVIVRNTTFGASVLARVGNGN